jgi:hypothetical protein
MAQTGGERSDGGVYGSAVAAAGWQRGRLGAPTCAPSRTECLTSRASVRAIACSTSRPERESKSQNS